MTWRMTVRETARCGYSGAAPWIGRSGSGDRDLGSQSQAAPKTPRHYIRAQVGGGGHEDQHHGAVESQFGDRAIDEEPESPHTQNAQDGGLAHDDFPSIKQKGEELQINAGQDFIRVSIDAARRMRRERNGVRVSADERTNDAPIV